MYNMCSTLLIENNVNSSYAQPRYFWKHILDLSVESVANGA